MQLTMSSELGHRAPECQIDSLLRGLQSPRVADPDLVVSTSNIQLTVRGYRSVAYGLSRNSI